MYEAQKLGRYLNYRKIWETQSCLDEYKEDLAKIAKKVYDLFNDPQRQILNIGEYAKRELCWNKLNESSFELSSKTISALIDKEEKEIDDRMKKKDQKIVNEVCNEIAIFKLGIDYWKKVQEVGIQLKELTPLEVNLCDIAIKYIKQIYPMLSKKQAKDIWDVKLKMDKYMGE